jgi:hypothetical protein
MMPPGPPRLPDFLLPRHLASRTDLTPADKIAFAAVWSSIGIDGLCVEPLRRLCEATGLADRTMRDALGRLVGAGVLTPIKRPGSASAWAVTPAENAGVPRLTPAENAGPPALPTPAENAGVGVDDPWEYGTLPVPTPAENAAPHARAQAQARTLLPNQEERIPDLLLPSGGKRGAGEKPAGSSPVTLPEGWVPDDALMAASSKVAVEGVDLSRELAKFRAYWIHGKGSTTRRTAKGWRQTWLRWVEKADPAPASAAAPGGARAASPAGAGVPQESEAMARLRRMAGGQR